MENAGETKVKVNKGTKQKGQETEMNNSQGQKEEERAKEKWQMMACEYRYHGAAAHMRV